jgi:tetratricopeptide (TPR) repeat protein
MGHDVFISYARRTAKPAAQQLQADLAQAGLSVFLDEREIPFGAPFPAELARGLLDARVAVVFADEAYFQRPWCVHEFRLLIAAYRRRGDAASLASMVIALPVEGDLTAVTAQLPPALAAASWPTVAQPDLLAATVRQTVAGAGATLRQRLEPLNDDTIARMLAGADHPLAWSDPKVAPSLPFAALWSTADAPSARGEGFVGRGEVLWELVHECVSARAFTPARTVVLRGLGGCGKSLLAAEFVARYGKRFFPAGVVWIDAEAGPEGLLDRFAALWRQIAPGEPAPDTGSADVRTRLQELGRAVDSKLRAGTAAGELLWVIDGLPEPRGGDASGLASWCPSLHHVSVLVTTRRADTLRDADAGLALGPLAQGAAVALLTRPPVDKRWMTDDEWKAVVHWVGELPLVLAVLREGLIDGALAIETLRAAPEAEPAAESERLMEGLRGEVDDASLRGAAQAFELSWQALAQDGALADAACRIALLAPVPLAEPLLQAVAGETNVGKLTRRGWLQAVQAGDRGQRAFALHRVPASVLRLKIQDALATFEALFDGFARLVQRAAVAGSSLDRLDLHLNVAMGHLFRMHVVAAPGLAAAARSFVLAVVRIIGWEHRGLRYMAASVAHAFGEGEAFATELAAATDGADEAALAAIPNVLQPLRDSPKALQWMAQLLSDPRDAVRRQAVVHAPGLDADQLAAPLLRAILSDTRLDTALAAILDPLDAASFDRYLRAGPRLRDSLSALADALASGDATARRRAARIVGRALAMHGRELQAGGFSADWLVKRLLDLALSDDDEAVRTVAAKAAGGWFGPTAWQRLCGAVAGDDPAVQMRAIAAAGQYLAGATAPRTPKVKAEIDDEGHLSITGTFGDAAPPLPDDVPQTLIHWVLDLPAPASAAAATALASLQQGLAACAPFVHAHLNRQDYALVHRLADALVQAKPDFVNAWWWRGQARAGLGDDSGGSSDFEAVLKIAPAFTEAGQQLAEALLRLGMKECSAQQFDTAAPRLLRAGELLPDRFNAHHGAALCLYNLQRYDDAEASATRAIGISPAVGEAWFFRALARYAAGRVEDALADLRKAVELSPDDERILGFRDDIERWLRNRDGDR